MYWSRSKYVNNSCQAQCTSECILGRRIFMNGLGKWDICTKCLRTDVDWSKWLDEVLLYTCYECWYTVFRGELAPP